MLPLLIGAGIGLLKGGLDKGREGRDRKLAAATQRLSPWTGLKADPVKEADILGSTIQGGLTGAQVGAGLQQADFNQALLSKLKSGAINPSVQIAMNTPQLRPDAMGLSNPFGPNPYSNLVG